MPFLKMPASAGICRPKSIYFSINEKQKAGEENNAYRASVCAENFHELRLELALVSDVGKHLVNLCYF